MVSCIRTFEHIACVDVYSFLLDMQYIILVALPLASSGFAAIGCFRASPYGGIYILKSYSKLTAKKSTIFF